MAPVMSLIVRPTCDGARCWIQLISPSWRTRNPLDWAAHMVVTSHQPPATSDPASAGEASWPITGTQATVWATVWATGWATGWECPMLTPSGVSGHVAGSDLEG